MDNQNKSVESRKNFLKNLSKAVVGLPLAAAVVSATTEANAQRSFPSQTTLPPQSGRKRRKAQLKKAKALDVNLAKLRGSKLEKAKDTKLQIVSQTLKELDPNVEIQWVKGLPGKRRIIQING